MESESTDRVKKGGGTVLREATTVVERLKNSRGRNKRRRVTIEKMNKKKIKVQGWKRCR